jgi:hypothetical protein
MPAPTFYPRNVVSRKTQLGITYQLATRLGLETREGHDRTAYEARLLKLIGRRSLKGATREQRQVVIRAFEAEVEANHQRVEYVAMPPVSDEEALSVLA